MRPITLVNKYFVPWVKMSVYAVFLDAEFKYVSRTSLSSTHFALHQTVWKQMLTYETHWGPVGGRWQTGIAATKLPLRVHLGLKIAGPLSAAI
jgi:hypothetical protein